MTIRMCDNCGATDDEVAIIRWRPKDNYLYQDFCPKCLKERKQKYKDEGYTAKDDYDV